MVKIWFKAYFGVSFIDFYNDLCYNLIHSYNRCFYTNKKKIRDSLVCVDAIERNVHKDGY